MDCENLVGYSQHAKLLIFISLMVICYFLYMDEAIGKYESKATALASRDFKNQGTKLSLHEIDRSINYLSTQKYCRIYLCRPLLLLHRR